MRDLNDTPLLAAKAYDEPSVFVVENLLREARRQRSLGHERVPAVCVLDPDGDLVRRLVADGRARRHTDWACYHTELWITAVGDRDIGIVPCAVGASFAVLVAEELHASGCSLIVSVTSAGVITPVGEPPYFILIDNALRDEGTSLHYLPAAQWSRIAGPLSDRLVGAFASLGEPVHVGPTWTTDAPFRETATAIDHARRAECSPSRWKHPRCTPTPRHDRAMSYASHTSPTPWQPTVTTSRRARPTARTARSQ